MWCGVLVQAVVLEGDSAAGCPVLKINYTIDYTSGDHKTWGPRASRQNVATIGESTCLSL
jgi:hypothetical protein